MTIQSHLPTHEQNKELEERQTALLAGSANGRGSE
jgi:hypothetical protein